MVTNFEHHTTPLTVDEKKLVVIIMEGLRRRTSKTPILARDIIAGVNVRLPEYGIKNKLTGARLRKIVNHIRSNGLLPLMAGSDGYYVSHDATEIARQIKSLRDRAHAIEHAAQGLETYLKRLSDALNEPQTLTLFDQIEQQNQLSK